MAAHTLRGLCRPRAGLALLCARFSQRPAAGTEYRSSHSLDKLYPPQQDGTAARTTEEPQPLALDIPMARLTVSYSRSSGPGGQNVNKVNSKAEVRFHLASADWIPEAVRQKMALMVPTLPFHGFTVSVSERGRTSEVSVLTLCFPIPQHRNKINRAGELIVTSEESRYQMRNLAICLEKIRAMVTEAIEKPRVVSKETAQKLIERVEKMNRERLRQKKIHSTIKQSRKADFD
ncbi:peptidyl-tRNA hydrolase ICT1, mitochondrial isoform X1 [Melozone crissalis]|uniref:peptidyl-tRNA hydrolase ICT1, mitochondrial isoform X1 n=1 Tax=Melozone crissalis TaxID=40204 RepID=UPI0023DCC2C5|nr:peptidyl-tRNA hydrolase ICT1, mitochondrial isoform X1 [Melozone crissalis]